MAFKGGQSLSVDIYDPESDKWWQNARLEVETTTHETVENGGSVYVTERWWLQLSVRLRGWAYEIGGDEGESTIFYHV